MSKSNFDNDTYKCKKKLWFDNKSAIKLEKVFTKEEINERLD